MRLLPVYRIEHAESIVAAVAAIEDKLAARIIYLKSQEVATVFEAREIVESLKFSKTTTRKIVDALENAWLFEYGRPEDRKRNLWTLTNIVNEVLRRRSRSAVAEMHKNVNLFDLVESIAKAA